MHAHLVDCADCLRYLGQIQLTSRLLSRRPDTPLADGLHVALVEPFRAATNEVGEIR